MCSHEHDSLPLGYEISGVQIIRFLGRGGFANTYLCKNLRSEGHLCVLKELFPMDIVYRAVWPNCQVLRNSDAYADEVWTASVKNFTDEVRVLQSLDIKNIPQFLDAFVANNTYYLVQEYIDGTSLSDYRIQLENSVDKVDITIQLLKNLLVTLSAIHQNGVLHRDIKPENIIIRSRDSVPVLIDFGGVRFQVGGITYNLDRRVGSRGYSSPEQTREALEQSESSDLYALAATFYFVLFGEEPPDSNDRLLGTPEKKFMSLVDIWPAFFLESLQRAFLLKNQDRFQLASEWLAGIEHMNEISTPLKIWRIGRDPEQVDVLLTGCSNTVSRVHLEIHLHHDGVWLIDCSSNGVKVLKHNKDTCQIDPDGKAIYMDTEFYIIDGKFFIKKSDISHWAIELDLGGNIYKLSDLIDLDEPELRDD